MRRSQLWFEEAPVELEERSDGLPKDHHHEGHAEQPEELAHAPEEVEGAPLVHVDLFQGPAELGPQGGHLVPVGEGEELCQVEDDGEEEEEQGVAEAGLRAEAGLEAVDRVLKEGGGLVMCPSV